MCGLVYISLFKFNFYPRIRWSFDQHRFSVIEELDIVTFMRRQSQWLMLININLLLKITIIFYFNFTFDKTMEAKCVA